MDPYIWIYTQIIMFIVTLTVCSGNPGIYMAGSSSAKKSRNKKKTFNRAGGASLFPKSKSSKEKQIEIINFIARGSHINNVNWDPHNQ